MNDASQAPPRLKPDRDEIRRALDVLIGEGRTFEIRAILKGRGAQSEICRTIDEGVEAALRFAGAKAVYFTLNAIRDDLNGPAKDGDVVRRTLLLVDCDPVRPEGVGPASNTTDREKQAAYEQAVAIRDFLAALGWPRPALIDSGNGWHLVFAIDLPNDEAAQKLVKAVLEELARRFDTDRVRVDRTVHNASRISKLPATPVKKGPHSPERPHRVSRMIETPSPGEVVTRAMLEALANEREGHRRAAKIVDKFGAATDGRLHDAMVRAAWALTGLVNEGQLAEADAERYYAETAARNGSDADHCRNNITAAWTSALAKPHKSADPYPSANGTPRGAEANGQPAGSATADDGGPDDDTEVIDRWPAIPPEAFGGIAGDVVALVDPHTEADRAAVLVQFLVAFSNMVGRLPYFLVSGTRHHLNLFAALVGATASGRKGTSWDVVTWLLRLLDEGWADDRIQGGLVSGEGLIHHVRDATTGEKKNHPGETVVIDEGVMDKRLLIVETEFSRTLKAMAREGNTLSDVLRQAWDHGKLRTLGKNSPVAATGAFISIVAHITGADIKRHLTETDSANGFANRFLWSAVRRSKCLPDGGQLDSVDWFDIVDRLRRVTADARARGEHKFRRDRTAGAMWADVYEPLSAGKPGLLGAVLSRAEAQVMRVACIYAMLDSAPEVRPPHLAAALALWEFCEASGRFIFGDCLGDPDAEKLLEALRNAPAGLTRRQIYIDVFHHHRKSGDIVKLLSFLLTQALIHRTSTPSSGGRPTEVWFAGREKPPAH